MKQEQEKAVNGVLLKNVIINVEERYEVKYFSLENHSALSNNRTMAISRLQYTTRNLKVQGLFDDYNAGVDTYVTEFLFKII